MNSASAFSRRNFIKVSSLWAVGTAVTGCNSLDHGPESLIDIHQHVGYHGRDDATLLAHQRAMGATKTILLPAGRPVNRPSTNNGVSNGLEAKCLGNEACYRLAKENPKEYLFGANEVPDLPDAIQEIEKYLKLGAVVIGEQKFGVECDSPEMQRIYELAGHYHVPVLMHWQYKRYNYGFERFYKMLEKFPKTTFVGHAQTFWAHIDKSYVDDTKDLYPKGKTIVPGGITDRYLSDYPNMYGDLSAGSGLNAFTRDEDHTRKFFTRHQDKLIYGSDCEDSTGTTPQCQGAKTIAVVRRLAETKTIERKLLFANARRVFHLGIILLLLLLMHSASEAQVTSGEAHFSEEQLKPGSLLDLDGRWLYEPGYLVKAEAKAELGLPPSDCVSVPVPQLLNRVYWWLDDSEDFKAHEDARLKKLGFDTEKAEDGWYRLAIDLPTLPPSRHLFLDFEGVAMKTKAYCNGELLGEHVGMFSRFSFELTPNLKPGTNIISVFVSMEKIPPSTLSMGEAVTVNLTASKVRSLSKGMYGPLAPGFPNRAYDLHGIWQPVRLRVCDAARLDDVWFTPSLEGAEVRVKASVLGDSGDKAPRKNISATLTAQWTDLTDGKLFAEASPERINLSKATESTIWLSDVKPRLWTPANPNLYGLQVSLEAADGRILDVWNGKVGFRTFEIRTNRFFLNGKPYWLRGANHLPYGKNPWDKDLPRRLIQLLHDDNVRITRTHATPWNEAWLDAADEIGLAVSVEGFRPWGLAGKIGPTPPDLFKVWLSENEDLIKHLRNHPSVFIYTIGNEMMLKDSKSVEKWEQLSTVVKQTRKIDPTRPVIASSEYQREKGLYEEVIEAHHLDDGDIDDIHRYNNWYGMSSFVTNALFEPEMKKNLWHRPFIGQEMSSGYPDLDTGLPVLRYTRDLLTPQAWVGQSAYPGGDPAIFLEHHRAVTKRWAEQLRYQRGNRTAGFMLFAAECWFSHSYDAATVSPYPVCASIKQAWAPVGVALETGCRRFYGGEDVETAVFITNDSEDFHDIENSELQISVHEPGTNVATNTIFVPCAGVAYYETKKIPVRIRLPEANEPRQALQLTMRLVQEGKEIGFSTEPIEIFQKPGLPKSKLTSPLIALSTGSEITKVATEYFSNIETELPSNGDPGNCVVILGSGVGGTNLAADTPLRRLVEQGATAIVMSPGLAFTQVFGEDILEVKKGPVEFADTAPIARTTLSEGIRLMDVKWWGRTNDTRVFAGSQSHRLTAKTSARVLLQYIPPHSYIAADKVPEQYRTVLFELKIGKGRIWVCDLDFEETLPVDPIARQFAGNLFRAAADPESTSQLPKLLTHEELLARNKNLKRPHATPRENSSL
jgi:predicted TIM-barrel fold metal-dependent hydrolase